MHEDNYKSVTLLKAFALKGDKTVTTHQTKRRAARIRRIRRYQREWKPAWKRIVSRRSTAAAGCSTISTHTHTHTQASAKWTKYWLIVSR